MERIAAFLDKELNRGPKDEIGRSEALKSLVRGPKLENGFVSPVKEYGSGDRSSRVVRQDNETRSGLDNQIVNIKEKGKRLGGQAVPATRSSVHAIELKYRVFRLAYLEIKAGAFGFADRASD